MRIQRATPTASFAAWIPLGGCYAATEETPRGEPSHGDCTSGSCDNLTNRCAARACD